MQVEIAPGTVLNVNLDSPARDKRNNPHWPAVPVCVSVSRSDNSLMVGEHVGSITAKDGKVIAYVSRSVVGFAFDIQFEDPALKGRRGKLTVVADFKDALVKLSEAAVEWAAAEYQAPPPREGK